MPTIRTALHCATLLGGVLLTACSSTTLVSEHFGPIVVTKPLSHVVVVGVSEDIGQRQRFEQAFAAALRATANVEATPATTLVAPERSLDHDELHAAMAGRDIDGVLVVRKTGERAEVTEVRSAGRVHDVDAAAFDDFHDRYLGSVQSGGSDLGTSTGVTRLVRVDVTLVRSSDFQEIWTGTTDSRDPRELDRVAGALADIVVARLRSKRIL